MDREAAVDMLDRLQSAQNDFYGGGSSEGLEALLAPYVVWTVPGDSPIAGSYRGLTEVLEYFERRRDLADRSFRMHRRDVLTGEGSVVAALTDGTARIGGVERRWSTVGLYEVTGRRIAACRLIPFDQAEFDAIWSEEEAT